MICIYCDNGARWEDVQDGDELSKKDLPKNSERTPDKRERFDPINKIWAKGLVGCERSEELGDVMMQTYRWSGKSAYDIEYGGDELRGRNAITVRETPVCCTSKAN
jgi:hypothetical protein